MFSPDIAPVGGEMAHPRGVQPVDHLRHRQGRRRRRRRVAAGGKVLIRPHRRMAEMLLAAETAPQLRRRRWGLRQMHFVCLLFFGGVPLKKKRKQT